MYDHRINLTGTTQLLSLYKYVHCAYTHVTSYTHEYFEFVLPAYQCVNVPVWDEVNQSQHVRVSQIKHCSLPKNISMGGVCVVLSYPVRYVALDLPMLIPSRFWFLCLTVCDHGICVSRSMKNQDGHWVYLWMSLGRKNGLRWRHQQSSWPNCKCLVHIYSLYTYKTSLRRGVRNV